GGLIVVENFELPTHKTKDFAATLERLGLDRKTLIVDSVENNNLALSSRNLPNVKFIRASSVNVYELLTHEKLAITREAVSQLDQQLSQ
ncbi:MAG TPA: 50S ribosomal protein L4, partial [Blastocatellia bacterium]|nr:50S ribosomal protein L4 [Blastocatellia bacterium]